MREPQFETPFPLGVLASGRGTNLQAILDAIEGGLPARVAIVLSNRSDAGALERVRKVNIPAEFVDPALYPDRRSYDEVLADRLTRSGARLIVLAGYMRLVTPEFVRRFPNRIINIHPSLLPAFPGLHAQRQAIAHGVKLSGCTIHLVDEEVDHGPIIIQAAVPVLEEDTEEDLSARIAVEEHRILPLAIRYIAEGRIVVEGRRVKIIEKRHSLGGAPRRA